MPCISIVSFFFFFQFHLLAGPVFFISPRCRSRQPVLNPFGKQMYAKQVGLGNHLHIILDKFGHQNRSKAQTAFNSTYFASIKYKVPYSFAFLYSDLLATSGTWVSLISTKSWLGSDLIAKTQFEIGPTVVKMGSVPFWSSTGQIG